MVTRTYIKIKGEPLLKGIKALEKMAVDTPKVCIMNRAIVYSILPLESPEGMMMFPTDSVLSYFSTMGDITHERCETIISKSGKLGEYDFLFEWHEEPSPEEIAELNKKIKATLTPLGFKFDTVTRKE